MRRYTYETRLHTVGDLVMRADGLQTIFEISGFHFRKAKKQPAHGIHYYVSYTVNASSYSSAVRKIDKKFLGLEDALSFYYCMPVIWEYWYYFLVRPDEKRNRIILSLFAPRDGVVMRSHIPPSEEIDLLLAKIESEPKFADALYYHGSLTRIDNLEFTRAHLPIMFQFIESVVNKKDVVNPDGTKRASIDHADARKMLTKGLHKELYSPAFTYANSVRNTVMHGVSMSSRSNGLRSITQGHVEDVVKRTRARIIEKYSLSGIDPGTNRVDVVRYFYSREGNRASIERTRHKQWTLEDYVNDFEKRKDPRIFHGTIQFPKSW